MDCQKTRNANTFLEKLAHTMARRLRRDHRHIHKWRRNNLSKMNVETVSEHQSLSGAKMRFDGSLVDFLLRFVREKNHDHVRVLDSVLDCGHRKSLFLRPV